MKNKKAVVLLALTLAASVNLWAQELPRLAVVEFSTNNSAEKTKQDAITVRNLTESQMVATRKYQIITRDEIDKLLANQQIQVSSISSAENIKKLQLQNISYIVTGSVDAMGTDYAVMVKILDVATGQFSHSGSDLMGGVSKELYTGVGTLIDKFIAGMSSHGEQVVQTGQGGRSGRYKIGDTGPGGGIVFAVEDNTGMEVSRMLGTFDWNGAKSAASSYRGGGMSDWHLPSKDELNLIYENLQKAGVINGGASWYWSSSQYDGKYAWLQNFDDGRQAYFIKYNAISVCAVRAF